MTGATAFQKAETIGRINNDQRQEFLAFFARRDNFIWKAFGTKRWEKAKGPLLDRQILGVISDTGRGLYRGCYWSHKTRHAVLDIDANSVYHRPTELQGLAEKLSAVGLSATPYQSSNSGGWHVYLFFTDWEESSEVQRALKLWLKKHGYKIESGQLEVFPSGNALRLPLQKGFAWLDQNGDVIKQREEITEDEALASFVLDAGKNSRNWAEAKKRIKSQMSEPDRAAGRSAQEHREALNCEGFDDLFRGGQIEARIEEARHYLDKGLTGKGQKHAALFSIQHLLWFGDKGRGVPRLPGGHNDEKRIRYVRQWLEKNHNGWSKDLNQGNWRDLEGSIRRSCQWRRDLTAVFEYVPYMVTERAEDRLISLSKKTGHLWKPEDLERANLKREELAREKIRAAVEQLESAGQKLTIRGLARVTGCHRDTIRRHSDIWSISNVVPLSNGTGDLDPGGQGGTASPPVSEEEFLKSLWVCDSADSPVIRDLAAAEHCARIFVWCLTPRAFLNAGRRRVTIGSVLRSGTPPSPEAIKAQGSSTGFRGHRYACGEIFLWGLGTRKHRQWREGVRWSRGPPGAVVT